MDDRRRVSRAVLKERLFAEIVRGTTAELVDGLARAYADTLEEAADVRRAFRELARRFLAILAEPGVLQLRRLVIAEADRFPDICTAWFDDGFHKALVLLGESMTRLADRGLLRELPDPPWPPTSSPGSSCTSR